MDCKKITENMVDAFSIISGSSDNSGYHTSWHHDISSSINQSRTAQLLSLDLSPIVPVQDVPTGIQEILCIPSMNQFAIYSQVEEKYNCNSNETMRAVTYFEDGDLQNIPCQTNVISNPTNNVSSENRSLNVIINDENDKALPQMEKVEEIIPYQLTSVTNSCHDRNLSERFVISSLNENHSDSDYVCHNFESTKRVGIELLPVTKDASQDYCISSEIEGKKVTNDTIIKTASEGNLKSINTSQSGTVFVDSQTDLFDCTLSGHMDQEHQVSLMPLNSETANDSSSNTNFEQSQILSNASSISCKEYPVLNPQRVSQYLTLPRRENDKSLNFVLDQDDVASNISSSTVPPEVVNYNDNPPSQKCQQSMSMLESDNDRIKCVDIVSNQTFLPASQTHYEKATERNNDDGKNSNDELLSSQGTKASSKFLLVTVSKEENLKTSKDLSQCNEEVNLRNSYDERPVKNDASSKSLPLCNESYNLRRDDPETFNACKSDHTSSSALEIQRHQESLSTVITTGFGSTMYKDHEKKMRSLQRFGKLCHQIISCLDGRDSGLQESSTIETYVERCESLIVRMHSMQKEEKTKMCSELKERGLCKQRKKVLKKQLELLKSRHKTLMELVNKYGKIKIRLKKKDQTYQQRHLFSQDLTSSQKLLFSDDVSVAEHTQNNDEIENSFDEQSQAYSKEDKDTTPKMNTSTDIVGNKQIISSKNDCENENQGLHEGLKKKNNICEVPNLTNKLSEIECTEAIILHKKTKSLLRFNPPTKNQPTPSKLSDTQETFTEGNMQTVTCKPHVIHSIKPLSPTDKEKLIYVDDLWFTEFPSPSESKDACNSATEQVITKLEVQTSSRFQTHPCRRNQFEISNPKVSKIPEHPNSNFASISLPKKDVASADSSSKLKASTTFMSFPTAPIKSIVCPGEDRKNLTLSSSTEKSFTSAAPSSGNADKPVEKQTNADTVCLVDEDAIALVKNVESCNKMVWNESPVNVTKTTSVLQNQPSFEFPQELSVLKPLSPCSTQGSSLFPVSSKEIIKRIQNRQDLSQSGTTQISVTTAHNKTNNATHCLLNSATVQLHPPSTINTIKSNKSKSLSFDTDIQQSDPSTKTTPNSTVISLLPAPSQSTQTNKKQFMASLKVDPSSGSLKNIMSSSICIPPIFISSASSENLNTNYTKQPKRKNRQKKLKTEFQTQYKRTNQAPSRLNNKIASCNNVNQRYAFANNYSTIGASTQVSLHMNSLINNLKTVQLISDQELISTSEDIPVQFWETDFTQITMSKFIWDSVVNW